MPSPVSRKSSDLRLSKKGLERRSGKGKVQGGFGDTKKVVVLAGLGLLAVGLMAYQFIGGSSPSPAKAGAAPAAPTTSAAATTASTNEIDAVLEEAGGQASDGEEDGLSVERVERLVRKFDTYVQERQIPLTGLRVNPFQVMRTVRAEAAQEKAQQQADAEAEARRQRILQAAAGLKLGAVLIAGSTRTAIIEGRLYHVGDVVEGMRVAAIGRDHVTLAYADRTVNLRLRPETPTP